MNNSIVELNQKEKESIFGGEETIKRINEEKPEDIKWVNSIFMNVPLNGVQP